MMLTKFSFEMGDIIAKLCSIDVKRCSDTRVIC